MPTLPNMALVTPAPGGDSGTWDDKINACFVLIDAHDHTSGKGVPIASAALSIDADVAWGGFGITGLGKLSFTTIAAPSTGSKALFVSSADNELYWRTNSGTNVKLTNGTSINTTLVGGIVGDYSTIGAEVAYSAADQVYTFKDGSSPSKRWARIAGGTIRVYEHDTTESVYVELAAPAALGASYTMTFPTALPGSTSLVQIDASGNVTFSNTLPSFGHGDLTLSLNAYSYSTLQGSWTTTTGAGYITSTGVARAHAPVPLRVGDRAKSVSFYCFGDGAADLNVTVYKIDHTAGTTTSLGSTSVTNPAASPWSITTIDITDTTITSNISIYVMYEALAANLSLGSTYVTYDRP